MRSVLEDEVVEVNWRGGRWGVMFVVGVSVLAVEEVGMDGGEKVDDEASEDARVGNDIVKGLNGGSSVASTLSLSLPSLSSSSAIATSETFGCGATYTITSSS